jgi:hypothetical protein
LRKGEHLWGRIKGKFSDKNVENTCMVCGVRVKLFHGPKGGLYLNYFSSKGKDLGKERPECRGKKAA